MNAAIGKGVHTASCGRWAGCDESGGDIMCSEHTRSCPPCVCRITLPINQVERMKAALKLAEEVLAQFRRPGGGRVNGFGAELDKALAAVRGALR